MPAGRPISKWTEIRVKKLAKKITAYCREAEKRKVEIIPGDNGSFKVLGPELPTIEDCLRKNHASSSTVYALKEKWPQLEEPLKKLSDISKQILVSGALQGAYNPTFSIFSAKNMFGWRDVQEFKGNGFGGNQIVIFRQDAPKEKEIDPENRIRTQISPV